MNGSTRVAPRPWYDRPGPAAQSYLDGALLEVIGPVPRPVPAG
jgi:hypothetical protein